jgi:hypothetical protein
MKFICCPVRLISEEPLSGSINLNSKPIHMKKSIWIKSAFAATIMLALTVSACKKNSTTPASTPPAGNEETTSSADNANSEHISTDLTQIVAEASDGSSAGLSSYRMDESGAVLLTSCATVTRDTLNKKITITFSGSSPCMDGRTRSGSIMVNYFASAPGAIHYRDPGFSCAVSSANYVVDGNQVNIINKVVTNTTIPGFNPATTALSWTVNAHLSIVKSGGGTIDYSCTHIKKLINTADTTVYHGASRAISWMKARIGITGTETGTTTTNVSYNSTITSMLIRDYGSCSINGRHPIIQGTIQFTPSGHPIRTIDYGNGSCDNTATVTVNGITVTITLN